MITKICPVCGNEFVATRESQIRCLDPDCKRQWRKRYQRKYYRENKDACLAAARIYQKRARDTSGKFSKKKRIIYEGPGLIGRPTLCSRDILHTRAPEKVARMINGILKGENKYTYIGVLSRQTVR